MNGIAYTVYFLLQWSFLNVKMHVFRDKYDILYTLLYAQRAKRCNVPSSPVLLIKLFFVNVMLITGCFFLYENVTSLGLTLNSGSDLAFT